MYCNISSWSYGFLLLIVFKYTQAFQCLFRSCPDIPVKPVCGSDMRNYGNMCKLREASCRNEKKIKKAYDGRCHKACDDARVARKLLIEHHFNTDDGECKRFGPPNDQAIKFCLAKLFNKIDKNSKQSMKYKGFLQFFHQLKPFKRGRKCIKTLAKYCDSNRDKKLSKNELSACFVEGNTVRSGPSCRGKSFDFQCASDGNFAPMQCVRNVCYCSESNGNVIVHFKQEDKSKYDCDKVRKDYEVTNSLKVKCPESSLDDLINQYKLNVEDEVLINAPHVVKPTRASMDSFIAERGFRSLTSINKMLNWKFKQLDRNKDGELDAGEMVIAKKELKDISAKCTNLLVHSCNTNNDKFLSRREWRHCFGFKKGGAYKKPPQSILHKGATTPSTAGAGCPPVALCTLSCTAGFERNINGCITCKCRDFGNFLSSWKETKRTWATS